MRHYRKREVEVYRNTFEMARRHEDLVARKRDKLDFLSRLLETEMSNPNYPQEEIRRLKSRIHGIKNNLKVMA